MPLQRLRLLVHLERLEPQQLLLVLLLAHLLQQRTWLACLAAEQGSLLAFLLEALLASLLVHLERLPPLLVTLLVRLLAPPLLVTLLVRLLLPPLLEHHLLQSGHSLSCHRS